MQGLNFPRAMQKEEPGRYLAVDFETNGLPQETWLRPCAAFPTQVSVDAYVPSTGEILHLYDSLVHGALDLTAWALANTPVTLEALEKAPLPEEVVAALASLWREGDVLVAHNARFDLGAVLPLIAAPSHPFLASSWICTKNEPWVRLGVGKQPSLADMCSLLAVPFSASAAHDVVYDTHSLACCLRVARERNLTWSMQVPLSASPDRRVNLVKLEPEDEVLRFGKYKGCRFGTVLREREDYCRYMRHCEKLQHPQAMRFQQWLETQLCPQCGRFFCHCASLALFQDQAFGAEVLGFGPHKGKTFMEAASRGFRCCDATPKSRPPRRRFSEWLNEACCGRCGSLKNSRDCCIYD